MIKTYYRIVYETKKMYKCDKCLGMEDEIMKNRESKSWKNYGSIPVGLYARHKPSLEVGVLTKKR